MSTVFVVHCVDTEGPLYEPINATFEMLSNVFGIELEPNETILNKLQKELIPLNGMERAVSNLLEKHKITTLGSWDRIDEMLQTVTGSQFREDLLDSDGNGWIYNWFCMDHVGFNGLNPRRRDAGYHNIFDHYTNYPGIKESGDMIQFHHHPIPFSGDYNHSATAFWGKSTINDILTRRIIDRNWFPSVFRPGFHSERPDSHWFLEQYIPFDYGNQSVMQSFVDQPDCANGRFGDWRHAPLLWRAYHPSHDDYQKVGECRRWIARCLNMNSRLREINIEDVRDAFKLAESGENALLSFTNHDYKCMDYEVNKLRAMLRTVTGEFPNIPFKYVNALEGMLKTENIKKQNIDLQLNFEINENGLGILHIKANEHIFGPQPYLAIKTLGNNYYWDNLDFQSGNSWSYTFDYNNFAYDTIRSIGVAGCSTSGSVETIVLDMKSQVQNRVFHFT